MTHRPHRSAAGFTLIELLSSLVILGLVTGVAFLFMGSQQQSFASGTDRVEMLQNYRFALDAMDHDIRLAGVSTPAPQQILIYADTHVVAFNADYRSNVSDLRAVYIEPELSNEQQNALTVSRAITIPNSSWNYPNQNPPGGSNAETIVYYFELDASTPHASDYVLKRKINDTDPEVVARGIVRSAAGPFFEYDAVLPGGTAVTTLPSTSPIWHAADFHGLAGDTEVIDNIRAIRINLGVTNGRSGSRERRREVSRRVWITNAGKSHIESCGSTPLHVSSVSATQVAGDYNVVVSWTASPDEASGEKDVLQYVIYRRVNGTTDWGSPIQSVPAGHTSFIDTSVPPAAANYDYAVAAQDCSPRNSELRTAMVAVAAIP